MNLEAADGRMDIVLRQGEQVTPIVDAREILILRRGLDQPHALLDIGRQGRPACTVAALPVPEQAKPMPVPRDDGIRLHENERGLADLLTHAADMVTWGCAAAASAAVTRPTGVFILVVQSRCRSSRVR